MRSEEFVIEKAVKRRSDEVFKLDAQRSENPFTNGYYEGLAELMIDIVCKSKNPHKVCQTLTWLLRRFEVHSIRKRLSISSGDVDFVPLESDGKYHKALVNNITHVAKAKGLTKAERKTILTSSLWSTEMNASRYWRGSNCGSHH